MNLHMFPPIHGDAPKSSSRSPCLVLKPMVTLGSHGIPHWTILNPPRCCPWPRSLACRRRFEAATATPRCQAPRAAAPPSKRRHRDTAASARPRRWRRRRRRLWRPKGKPGGWGSWGTYGELWWSMVIYYMVIGDLYKTRWSNMCKLGLMSVVQIVQYILTNLANSFLRNRWQLLLKAISKSIS